MSNKDKISFGDFINGYIIKKGFNFKNVFFVGFIVFLSIWSITNTYNTIKVRYDITILQKEIDVLRNRSIDYTVKLQELGREHAVKKMLIEKNINLIDKKEPAIEIVADSKLSNNKIVKQ